MQNKPKISRGSQNKKGRSLWFWILLIVCFLVAAIGGAIFASSGLLDKPEEPKKTEIAAEEPLLKAQDKATIMIMGVDERADDVGRSDTLMIATIDPEKDRVALLSIPRDTRIRIKGYGYDKINAAFAYGGERLTQNTVESFLGLDIDHYVIINTQAFVKIIDAVGGIDVDVEKRMYYEDPWDDDGGLIIDLYPGKQHMDGKTAITYVRYRDEEGDIGRIKRQQKFMQACLDKFTSPSIITSLPSVVSEIIDSVRTDLSLRQILEFAGTLKEAKEYGMRTEMVPGRPLYIDGISYWIPDIESLRTSIANTLDVSVDNKMRSNFERAAQEYESSIPSGARPVPESDKSIGRIEHKSSEREKKDPRKERTEKKSNEKEQREDEERSSDKDTEREEPARSTSSDKSDTDAKSSGSSEGSRSADTPAASPAQDVPSPASREVPSRSGSKTQ